MAGFHQILIFFMKFINIGPAYIREWVWGVWGWSGWQQKLKQRSRMTQIVEFRVGIMYTCSHKGPIFHYKTKTDVHWQWEPYRIPTAKLEASFGAILPVVDLNGLQKALVVNISQWRQCTCIVIYVVTISWDNKFIQFLCKHVGFLLRQSQLAFIFAIIKLSFHAELNGPCPNSVYKNAYL